MLARVLRIYANTSIEGEGQVDSDEFIQRAQFAGVRPGMVFQCGTRGVGYYLDKAANKTDSALSETTISDLLTRPWNLGDIEWQGETATVAAANLKAGDMLQIRCPNSANPYHECTQYCVDTYKIRRS